MGCRGDVTHGSELERWIRLLVSGVNQENGCFTIDFDKENKI